MSRRRWIQINGELVEVPQDYQPEPRSAKNVGALWNDREYQDAGDPRYHSRTSHREYMRLNGLATVDDFKDQWKKQEAARIDSRKGIGSVKPDVVEALRKTSAGYKPRLRREE